MVTKSYKGTFLYSVKPCKSFPSKEGLGFRRTKLPLCIESLLVWQASLVNNLKSPLATNDQPLVAWDINEHIDLSLIVAVGF